MRELPNALAAANRLHPTNRSGKTRGVLRASAPDEP